MLMYMFSFGNVDKSPWHEGKKTFLFLNSISNCHVIIVTSLFKCTIMKMFPIPLQKKAKDGNFDVL